VTDQNDDKLDRWLNEDVELLAPAPGTFERVRRRARQRKTRQALASESAGSAVTWRTSIFSRLRIGACRKSSVESERR